MNPECGLRIWFAMLLSKERSLKKNTQKLQVKHSNEKAIVLDTIDIRSIIAKHFGVDESNVIKPVFVDCCHRIIR